jgi:hypothetical protein
MISGRVVYQDLDELRHGWVPDNQGRVLIG